MYPYVCMYLLMYIFNYEDVLQNFNLSLKILTTVIQSLVVSYCASIEWFFVRLI